MLPNVLLNCLLGQYPTGLLYGVLERLQDLFSERAINNDIRRSMPDKEIRMEQILQSEAQGVWADFRKFADGARY